MLLGGKFLSEDCVPSPSISIDDVDCFDFLSRPGDRKFDANACPMNALFCRACVMSRPTCTPTNRETNVGAQYTDNT